MNLNNFERYVEPIIIERGNSYYRQDLIEQINDLGADEYSIDVLGSEKYEVYIALSSNLDIIRSKCSCPYDFSNICKHQVAAFYALQHLYNGTGTPQASLKKMLEQQTKEQLIDYLLDLANDIEGVNERLAFQLASEEDELTSSRMLIRNAINRFTHGDFISWKYVEDALHGAYVVLEKIESKLENLELQSAFQLAEVVMDELMDMLSYTDDSSGSVSMSIHDAIGFIQEICYLSSEFSNELEKKSIFQQTLNAVNKPLFDDIEWKKGLLLAGVELCDSEERKEQFTTQLRLLENQANRQSDWTIKYEIGIIKEIQLAFIERTEDTAAIELFLMQHIDNNKFRKRLIEHAMTAGDFEKVLTLLPSDQEKRQQWREEELAAYEGIGNFGKQKQILRQFILDGKRNYYDKYKCLYSTEKWPTVIEKLINELSAQRYISNAYIDILIVEKMWDRLLVICKQHTANIAEYYKYLKEDYEEEAKEIYENYLLSVANHSSNRSQYKAVCRQLKEFQKTCGREAATQLINKLQTIYKKRPAFLDELSKV